MVAFFRLQVHLQVQPEVYRPRRQINDEGSLERRIAYLKGYRHNEADCWPIAV